MVTSSAILISSQSRRGRGSSSVWLDTAEPWGGDPETRAYIKQQNDYCCRPAWRAWRRTPLLLREYRALEACRALGLKVPRVLHFETSGVVASMILEEVCNAEPLDHALQASAHTRALILSQVGEYLGRLHHAGWYHGALYAHHMLIGRAAGHELCLIDFEKARRSRHRQREDLQRFWRHNAYLSTADRQFIEQAYARSQNFK